MPIAPADGALVNKVSAPVAVSSAFMAVDPDEPEPIPDNKPLDKGLYDSVTL